MFCYHSASIFVIDNKEYGQPVNNWHGDAVLLMSGYEQWSDIRGIPVDPSLSSTHQGYSRNTDWAVLLWGTDSHKCNFLQAHKKGPWITSPLLTFILVYKLWLNKDSLLHMTKGCWLSADLSKRFWMTGKQCRLSSDYSYWSSLSCRLLCPSIFTHYIE